jgi:hypothetical protein
MGKFALLLWALQKMIGVQKNHYLKLLMLIKIFLKDI